MAHTLPSAEQAAELRKHLEETFDVNYAVTKVNVRTPDDFYALLLDPFLSQTQPVFYRGERINRPTRRLVPTFLRDPKIFKTSKEAIYTQITGESLLEYYQKQTSFSAVYETLYDKPDIDHLYPLLAFAQHYLDVSPFLDFSASLYVALSFALKGRTVCKHDIVLYTAYDIGDDDTTTDVEEVNRWLRDYKVGILRAHTSEELRTLLTAYRKYKGIASTDYLHDPKNLQDIFEGICPKAKLICIPTNDLMKYQQGVFLLLNDFCLIDSAYFTKSIRQNIMIQKYIIDKDLCPMLQKLLAERAPQYQYNCLLDISEAVRATSVSKSFFLKN